jgi:cell division transport system permease protein
MTVTLFTIGAIIFTSVILESILTDLKNKVDVNIYFVSSAPEGEIVKVKSTLEKMSEVAGVKYVTREEAIGEFKEKHKDDYLTLQALEELADNPLGARLNIIAKDPSQYESIVKSLEDKSALSEAGSGIIDKVNYRQNKIVIDRLTQIIAGARQIGFALALVLVLISLLITFNTVRLVIYMSREEIAIMRLVGASNMYVRGPFVVGGIIYGFISALIAMAFFYPVTLWLGGTTTEFFGGVNLFEYYVKHFFEMFLLLLGAGALLGAISSFLAVRKYLKV